VRRLVLLSVLFAVRLQAQDAASIARLVHASSIDIATLERALQSPDALSRATAARVALVRGVTIVPALRKQLDAERDANAARELVRAIAILGNDSDLEAAASQLQRFPATIDAAFVDAVRRSGRPIDALKVRAWPLPVVSASGGINPTKGISIPVKPPLFVVPFVLPRGLGAAILDANRCRAGWVGVVNVARDAAGRVQDFDTKGVRADGGCMDALRTVMRLSLAEAGPPATTPLLVFRPDGARPCFDEAVVSNTVPPLKGQVKAPKVVRRAEPRYSDSVRRQARGVFTVVAEATITTEGCVRDIRLVQQTIYPELNHATIDSLAKWTFTPGTLDGVPVDVLFNLTFTFRH
jgi:hypothetical protein